jgi:hypothetical protein
MTVGFIGGSYIFDLGDAASMIRLSILVQRYSVEMLADSRFMIRSSESTFSLQTSMTLDR